MLEARGEVLGDEIRGFLGEENVAIGFVQNVHWDFLEAAFADEADEGGHFALRAALAPIKHDAADGGVCADDEVGVIGLVGLDDAEADLLDFGDNLGEALAFEVLGVEDRGADQQLEAALVMQGAAIPRGAGGG